MHQLCFSRICALTKHVIMRLCCISWTCVFGWSCTGIIRTIHQWTLEESWNFW